MGQDDEEREAALEVVRYGNYFRVGHNAFEFLLDFGLFYPDRERPVMHTRIVTNPAYAKELSRTLQASLAAYEMEHGTIPDGDEDPGRP